MRRRKRSFSLATPNKPNAPETGVSGSLPCVCMLVPRTKFGSSLYNVPLLLALRFFYHASPFEAAVHHTTPDRSERHVSHFSLQDVALNSAPVPIISYTRVSLKNVLAPSNGLDYYSKLTTATFLAQLTDLGLHYSQHRLISLTWTKALGSPLSHEYIQFIIEGPRSGHRYRIATDRHVDGGDSVHVGWDWSSAEEPSQHHSLPLPLLSLTFTDGPNVLEFSKLLVEITNRKPEYSLMREMCWWYAEAIFEAAHVKYGGTVKEWDFAHLRYSFVVRTNVIKREKLVRHAEEFRKLNTTDMKY